MMEEPIFISHLLLGLLKMKGPDKVHAQRFNWRSKKREKKIDKRKSRYKKEDLFMEPIRKHKNMSNGDK
jgi:hypothetical protein